MKTIMDDPKGFLETGGWTFLQPESAVSKVIYISAAHHA